MIVLLEVIDLPESDPKKYKAVFEVDGRKKSTKFGATGYEDYTIHKDKERKKNYIARHKGYLKDDPTRASYLSMYILWNKTSFNASIADYKRRLNVYNKTGNFPKDI